MLAVIVLLGLWPSRMRTRQTALFAEVAGHGAGWLMILLYMLIWIPRAEKIFDDFGVELSAVSMCAVQIVDLMSRGWAVVVVPLLCGLLAVDGLVYRRLWADGVPQKTRNRFTLAMTLLPLSAVVLLGEAVVLPLTKLFGSLT